MSSKQCNTDQSGFTLIELMVVISIIALLSSVIVASFQPATADARDASRLEETHSVGNALELYYLANGHYPIHTNSQDISIQGMIASDLTPYMSALPSGFAVPNQDDFYVSDANGVGYELLVAKETAANISAGSGGAIATNSGCNSTDYGNYSTVVNYAYCQGSNNVTAPIWNAVGGGSSPGSSMSMSLSPPVVNVGQSVTLAWDATNAGSCQMTGNTTGDKANVLFDGDYGGAIPTYGNLTENVDGGDEYSGTITITCYSGGITSSPVGTMSASVIIQSD